MQKREITASIPEPGDLGNFEIHGDFEAIEGSHALKNVPNGEDPVHLELQGGTALTLFISREQVGTLIFPQD